MSSSNCSAGVAAGWPLIPPISPIAATSPPLDTAAPAPALSSLPSRAPRGHVRATIASDLGEPLAPPRRDTRGVADPEPGQPAGEAQGGQWVAQYAVQLGSLALVQVPDRCPVERRLRHREEVVAGDDAGDGESLLGSDLDL
jgi:hypothetical protein